MAKPSPELVKALNQLRDELMRLNTVFYAGTLSEYEQQQLAKHCAEMMKCTESIAPGTKRLPSEPVYIRMSELDGDEIAYIERIRSMAQSTPKTWVDMSERKQDKIGKGKIIGEGDKI